jgi:hypothetical protein
MDEYSRRTPSFRDGVKVRLADGQEWVFPAALKLPETIVLASEYDGLVHLIIEAEDVSEQRLAELALALYLLAFNYSLAPSEFEHLFSFRPESSEAATAASAFHQLAQEHVHRSLEVPRASWKGERVSATQGRLIRVLSWLRDHAPFVSWPFESRS